jgi:hypothetical protein
LRFSRNALMPSCPSADARRSALPAALGDEMLGRAHRARRAGEDVVEVRSHRGVEGVGGHDGMHKSQLARA